MARRTRKTLAGDNTADPAVSRKVYKTAVYVRLSVEDMRKKVSDSIGTQKTMLLQYIQTQPDMELYKIYEDINYTGTNFNRPGFAAMIEDIQSGVADCVVVKDLSRFGRNFEETGHYLERVFPFLQVRFISVNDGYDSLTATLDETSLIVPLKNLMNEVYARDLSKKTQIGFKQKRIRGEYCGGYAPYGYSKNGTSLEIDQETSPIVKQIFDWVLEGYGSNAIAQKLNNLKIAPPGRHLFEKGITKAAKHRDTKYWYKESVRRMVTNPVYTGVLAQSRQQSNFLNGGGRIKKSRDEWSIFENAHEAIIEKEIFDRVQEIRAQKALKSDEAKSRYAQNGDNCENIFKGLIFCADCKMYMSRERYHRGDGSSLYYFICTVYSQADKNACTKKRMNEADLKDALYVCIEKQIRLAVDMSRIVEDIKKERRYKMRNNTLDKKINELKQKLQQNQRYRGSLREDYKDCVISEQDYISMRSDYEEEKNNLQAELDLLESNKSQHNSMLLEENKYIAEFKKFQSDGHLSAQMVSALVERIEVRDYNQITVHFKYRDELNHILSSVVNTEQEEEALLYE